MGLARESGLGMTGWVSTGNEADCSSTEIAGALIERDEVRVVGLYLESINDTAGLMRLAERSAALQKPIVMLLAGKTASGWQAAKRIGAACEIHSGARLVNAIHESVFIVTKGLSPPPGFLQKCIEREVPVLSSPALSSVVIKRVSWFLEEHLVPTTRVHGVLLEVYGLGVLLIGGSGVGKSESALDLITRGHSLVADDRVTVKRYPNGELMGSCAEGLRHHMELRGLGIINVQDLFGLAAVRERKTIDLVVELEHWDESKPYDRLGLDESLHEILEVQVPYIRMPVALGRNVAILVEIAARNHVLKLQGHHSAREFARRLERELSRNAKAPIHGRKRKQP